MTSASGTSSTPGISSASTGADHYDLVVLGSTPGGIACAVRAAREGLRVLLISYQHHLGGMFAGGLGVTDTLYDGYRAPLYESFLAAVREHYRTTYGEDSEPYRACYKDRRHYFEPHVAERILTGMVESEPRIAVLRGYSIQSVERAERAIRAVTVVPFGEGEPRRVAGAVFVDASYEGDLAAAAGVPCRIGREARSEWNEQHAGRIFTTHGHGHFPREAHDGHLNLGTFPVIGQEIFAGSTGEGDGFVQTYNYRVCLSRDPANRRYPERPATYNRADYIGILQDQAINLHQPSPLRGEYLLRDVRHLRMGDGTMPNHKLSWNSTGVVGAQHGYPAGDWGVRRAIERRHRDFALGLLWFLQNDPEVPEAVREDARRWGLARDEFTDNDNFPTHLYIREARRIWGRFTFTEHDGTLAKGLRRTPIHHDSIAIAEWPMDSHECTTERQYASLNDGKFLLSEATRPSQIPYRCLLPERLDNLLVPVCLSSTHVGWGTLRLEPVWMHVGEVAGYAAALALGAGTTPGTLPVSVLQRTLVERQIMIAFFNDFDMSATHPWVPAVQYLGARGFFPSYDARPDAPLDQPVAREWARTFGVLLDTPADRLDAALTDRARALLAASVPGGPGGPAGPGDLGDPGAAVTADTFGRLLTAEARYRGAPEPDIDGTLAATGLRREAALTRGDACRLLYELLRP